MMWDTVWTPYAGADYSFQSLYDEDRKVGYIHSWDDDGDWGYDAYVGEDYIGTHKTRAAAQAAIEAAIK